MLRTRPSRFVRWMLPAVACWLAGACLVLPPAARAQEQAADAQATREYAVALGFQKRKLYPQAAVRWSRFIQAHPGDERIAGAHYHLGVCQFQQQQLAEAEKTFRTVLDRFPQFAHRDGAQFNLGLARYHAALDSEKPDDYRQAAAAFAEVVAKFAQSDYAVDALYYQAESLHAAGDAEAAVPVYRKAIAEHADSPLQSDLHYALGTTLEELEQHEEAAATFQTFLQKFPQAEQAQECRLRLGMAQFHLEKYAEAEQLFAQCAADAEFEHADFALLQQAHAVLEQERLPDAAALYESLPTKFPESGYAGAALLAGGKVRYRLEQFPQAETALAAVVKNEAWDEAPEASLWLGRTLVRLEKPAEAVAALDRAIAAHPQSDFLPPLTFGRIEALAAQQERRAETVALYAEFATKHADHPLAADALYRAGLTALQLAEYEPAARHADAFVANPSFAEHALRPDALFVGAEARLLADEPNLAQAEALYRRLIDEHAMHADVPHARVRVGFCLHAAGKHDEAVQFLTEAAGQIEEPALLAEARLLIGRSHAEVDRPAEAVTAFRAALAAKADWERGDEVLYVLGLALRSAGEADAATAELKRLDAGFPNSPWRDRAVYQIGEIALDRERYDEAIAAYRRVLAEFADSELAPPARYGVAASLFAKSEYGPAAEELTKLLTDSAEAAIAGDAFYLRGLCRHRQKEFQLAAEDLEQFLARKPDEQDALDARFALALCRVGLEQYPQAIAVLTALLTDKPDYADADKVHYELAFAHLAADQPDEAARAFGQLTTKLPDSPLAPRSWFQQGELHEKSEKSADAAKAYAAGLAKARKEDDPELHEALAYKLGAAQFGQEEYAEAAKTFEAQVREHPQGKLLVDAHWLAAESEYRLGRFQQALPHYAKVLALPAAKYHPRALYRSGDCTAALKQWAASRQHYQTLIGQFSDFEQIHEARYGLGLALQNENRLDEAKKAYEQVTKETDTETAARARFMIGECAFASKKYDEAVEHFLEAAFGYPYKEWQALGHFEAGRCFIELGDTDKARETLETLVEKFPDHARAKDAATLIANLNK